MTEQLSPVHQTARKIGGTPEEREEETEISQRQKALKEEHTLQERERKVHEQEQRAKYAEDRLREKRAYEAAKMREKKARGPSFLSQIGRGAVAFGKEAAKELEKQDRAPRRRRSRRKKGSPSRKPAGRAAPRRKARRSRSSPEYYEYLRLKRKFDR
jgi:hypothetical protein